MVGLVLALYSLLKCLKLHVYMYTDELYPYTYQGTKVPANVAVTSLVLRRQRAWERG